MNYPDFSKILFLDIETVSQEKDFNQLNAKALGKKSRAIES